MKQVLFFSVLFSIIFSTHIMAQIGACSISAKGILEGENGEIFKTEYDKYNVDKTVLSKGNFNGVSIQIVLGNWCEDSQREVPRFMKIFDTPIFDVPVSFHLVNREKFCADPEVQKLEVKYVPAFIFLRDGKEIGRIIETPEGSLEANMAKIVGQ